MMAYILAALLLATWLQPCCAQTDYDDLESKCIVPTKLTNCRAMDAASLECNAIDPNDQTRLAACVCAQSMYSSYIECREELRTCSQSTVGDAYLNDIIDAWHSKCDSRTTVTTPTFASTVVTANVESCQEYMASCSRYLLSASQCQTSYSAATDVLSCRCATPIALLGSICEYDGNKTCLATTAEITNLWEYSNCPGVSTIFTSVANVPAGSTSQGTPRPSASRSVTFDTPTFVPPDGSASSATASSFGHRLTIEIYCVALGLSLLGLSLAM